MKSCHKLTKIFDPCPAGDITYSYGLRGFSLRTNFQVIFYVLFKKGLCSFLYYAPQGKSQRQLSTQSYNLDTAWRAGPFLKVLWAEERSPLPAFCIAPAPPCQFVWFLPPSPPHHPESFLYRIWLTSFIVTCMWVSSPRFHRGSWGRDKIPSWTLSETYG